jgi:hypothetical protein
MATVCLRLNNYNHTNAQRENNAYPVHSIAHEQMKTTESAHNITNSKTAQRWQTTLISQNALDIS